MNLIKRPSPSFGARKDGKTARFVVLHFTAMESAEAACERLCDPEIEVSAHYLVAENGDVISMVDDAHRAWHAGAGYWAGETDMNSASIGIEIDNNGAQPFKEPQYQALIALLKSLQSRHAIAPKDVIGHQDMAISRKFDPGPWFDWHRLDLAGVTAPPKAQVYKDKSEQGFLEMAASAGYDGNAEFADLLMTIRMRHGATPYYEPLRDSDFDLLV